LKSIKTELVGHEQSAQHTACRYAGGWKINRLLCCYQLISGRISIGHLLLTSS